MNQKDILLLISGLVVGGIGGFYAAKKYYNDKFNDILDQEIEDIRAYYKEKNTPIGEETEIVDEEIEDYIDSTNKRVAKPNVEIEPNYDDIIEKLNYNKYSTKVKDDKKPYVISIDEYNDNNSLEKKIYSYFPDDEVVMDSETEEVVDNVNIVLGFNNLESIVDFEDTNEIYIRNERVGCDYQVILERGSYQDFIDGEY